MNNMLLSGGQGEMGTASFEALCSLTLYVLVFKSFKFLKFPPKFLLLEEVQ